MAEEKIVDMTKGVYRRVYAGFVSGRRLCSVSIGAEAWFWRLNATADDFGNRPADPCLMADAAGRRALAPKQVAEWTQELLGAGLIEEYEVAGDSYLHIVGFEDNQPAGKNGRRIQRHPAPSEGVPVNPGESKAIRVFSGRVQPPNPNPNPNPIPIPIPTAPGAGVVDPFVRFWKAYPRKVGKHEARKAWDKAGASKDIDRVLRMIRLLKESPDWFEKEIQFIPHPSTWINQRRWEDDDPPRAEILGPRKSPQEIAELVEFLQKGATNAPQA